MIGGNRENENGREGYSFAISDLSPGLLTWFLPWFALLPSVAKAEVIEILGTDYYVATLGLGVYKIVYLPAALIFVVLLYVLLLRHIRWRWLKWGLLPFLYAGLAALPYWDTYQIGQQAKVFCEGEAGLHVYKTAEADGFFGGSSIEYWSKYGFKYVESSGSGKYSIWTLVDGEKHHEYRDQLTSRYSWGTYENHVPVGDRFSRSASHMVDIQTGEVLGELITFAVPPGIWDSLILGASGLSFSPWICGDKVPAKLRNKFGKRYGVLHLILETLIPFKKGEGLTNED